MFYMSTCLRVWIQVLHYPIMTQGIFLSTFTFKGVILYQIQAAEGDQALHCEFINAL